MGSRAPPPQSPPRFVPRRGPPAEPSESLPRLQRSSQRRIPVVPSQFDKPNWYPPPPPQSPPRPSNSESQPLNQRPPPQDAHWPRQHEPAKRVRLNDMAAFKLYRSDHGSQATSTANTTPGPSRIVNQTPLSLLPDPGRPYPAIESYRRIGKRKRQGQVRLNRDRPAGFNSTLLHNTDEYSNANKPQKELLRQKQIALF